MGEATWVAIEDPCTNAAPVRTVSSRRSTPERPRTDPFTSLGSRSRQRATLRRPVTPAPMEDVSVGDDDRDEGFHIDPGTRLDEVRTSRTSDTRLLPQLPHTPRK